MNKIDILKEKIERGADFGAALEKIKMEAFMNANNPGEYSDYDRLIYGRLYEIFEAHPYETFTITGV